MRSTASVIVLLLGAFSAAMAAQGRPAPKPAAVPASELRTLDVPNESFTIAIPRKDWNPMLGTESVPVMLVQKSGEAHVIVERSRLNQPLTPGDLTDLFAKLESDVIRDRQPDAKDITAALDEGPNGRVVVVEFTRNGLTGPEKVRQYSIPAGRDLIRVLCAAPPARFGRYDAMFAAIGTSIHIKN